MFKRLSGNVWLGLAFIGFALLTLAVWIPLDVDTGLIENVRRRVTLGDSLGPTVAASVILIGGLLTALGRETDAKNLSISHLKWICLILAFVTIGFVIMRYAGPLITETVFDKSYRALRITPPYSYIGFTLGGAAMVGGLICLAQRRFSLAAFGFGFLASLVIAGLYDLPFDDLLLPPNGDV